MSMVTVYVTGGSLLVGALMDALEGTERGVVITSTGDYPTVGTDIPLTPSLFAEMVYTVKGDYSERYESYEEVEELLSPDAIGEPRGGWIPSVLRMNRLSLHPG